MPTQADLQARVPTGRLVRSATAFVLPQPAFGPGSVEDARRKAEELGLEEESKTASDGTYAGAGSYF